MSALCFDDSFVIAKPKLMKSIGINEAIILQRLHYWTQWKLKKGNSVEGWIQNSLTEWQEQFSYLAIRTIQRCFLKLENMGVIKTKNTKFKNTKSYQIDYERVGTLKLDLLDEKQTSLVNDYAQSTSCDNLSATSDNLSSSSANLALVINKDNTNKTKNISLTKKATKLCSEDKHLKGEHSASAREMISVFDDVVFSGKKITEHSPRLEKKLGRLFTSFFEDDLEQWKAFCQKITKSRFLMGESKASSFKINIHFLKEETVEKILAGAYREDRQVLSDKEIFDENLNLDGKSEDEVKFIQACREKIDDPSLKFWLKEVSLRKNEEDEEIVIEAKSDFNRNMLQSKFSTPMRSICASLFHSKHVGFAVQQLALNKSEPVGSGISRG